MEKRLASKPQQKAEPAIPQTADAALRQSRHPVYIEPRRSQYETEAQRAAGRYGQRPVDFQPTPLGAAGQRSPLGPDLSDKLTRELDRGGEALPGDVRGRLERHFHANLDGVRLVDNAVSDEIATAVDTHAFTVGQTIFLASGTFAPGDPRAERILAHEVTHALQQQRGSDGALVIQRDEPGAPVVSDVWPGTGANNGYILDFEQNIYTMPELKLPTINGKIKGKSSQDGITTTRIAAPFSYTTRSEDRETRQREKWIADVNTDKEAISGYIDRLAANPGSATDTNPFYYLKIKATNQIVAGTKDDLLARQEFLIPTWNKAGEARFFDADHYVEHQLGGEDEIANIWMLDNSVNRSAGTTIRSAVLDNINELYRRARADNFFVGGNANRDTLRFARSPRDQPLVFRQVNAGDNLGGSVDYWTVDQVKEAKHFRYNNRNLVTALTLTELTNLGLVAGPNGAPSTVLWFLSQTGSVYRPVDLRDPANAKWSGSPIVGNERFIKNFTISAVTVNPGFNPENATATAQMGSITGTVEGGVGNYFDRDANQHVRGKRVRVEADISLPLRYDPRYGYGSYIDKSGVRDALVAAHIAKVKGLSPLSISEVGLSDDWAMEFGATLTSTHPLFTGFQASLGLTVNGIQLDVDIPTDRLDFGFFRVTEASLSVAYGDEGLLFGGSAAFEVPQIGRGRIAAMGTVFEGQFDFDFDFVDPATIRVRYAEEAWTFGGELGISEGVIPGLKSGLITVGIDEEGGLMFDGTAQVQLPGQTQAAAITIAYSEADGVTIGGTVDFDTSAFPMIQNATVTVSANYDPDTGEWVLGGTGTAGFAFPGVTGSLTATYARGGIVIRGDGNVAMGNATGTFSFATGNFPLKENGEFDTTAEPTEDFDAYGSGSVSIAFGPYLTGTAGITYTPDDEIVISGGIALPPSITLFEANEYDRNLVRFPRLDFPIFGVTIPVVGSIGVFGFIAGSVRGFATIGPATLDDTAVDVTYTLGDPDSAIIHGESHLNFGMEAGLELALSGGLGLGAAIAELTGEVGITAALLLNVDAGADLDVNWTPLAGLSIDMALRGSAAPSFRVGVFGRVAAGVAIYGEVWSERWDRTLAEFGSGLEIGIVQPATWDEENGLDLDFANAVFTYPDFDIEEISSGIMEQIV
jgi:hypothetical protein